MEVYATPNFRKYHYVINSPNNSLEESNHLKKLGQEYKISDWTKTINELGGSIILVALISAQNQIQLSRAVDSCPSSFNHIASSMYSGVEFLFWNVRPSRLGKIQAVISSKMSIQDTF